MAMSLLAYKETLGLIKLLDFPFRPDQAQEKIAHYRLTNRLPELISNLVKLLPNFQTNVRVSAAQALGLIPEAKNNHQVIKELINLLPDQQIRGRSFNQGFDRNPEDLRAPGQVAAKVLGQWQIKDASPALIKIIADPSLWVWNRIAAIQALGEIKDEQAIPALQAIADSAEITTWQLAGEKQTAELSHITQSALQKIYHQKYLKRVKNKNTPT